jgi:HAE1 family hydrophobic/amphiphilic exporter-1
VESFKTLGIALMLSIFLVYVVMGSQFNSFVQPFIISFTIPLAIVGVILILWLTGTPLNLNSFLGGVVLAGIVVNNGILLVDFMNRKRRTMEFKPAVVEGAALRPRPILMTALTTILGMLPLARTAGIPVFYYKMGSNDLTSTSIYCILLCVYGGALRCVRM